MVPVRAFRLPSCLLVAFTGLILAACGGAQTRYARHLQLGQQYLAAGNLDKASVEFRNAGQIQPKEADPPYFNGRVAEARGNIREAVTFYRAALDDNAAHVAARAHLGKLFVFAGAPQRALDAIAPGLLAHPDDPDLLAVRAAARHQLKQDAGALADAEQAVKLAPANENAVAALAAIYADAKDFSRATSLVEAALVKTPASVDLHEVLTNLYLATAQPARAEEQMRKIIELRPDELSPRQQLALHFARAHDTDAAEQVLKAAVAAFSKDKNAINSDAAKLLLVDFIASERSRDQGEKTLRTFIAQDPDNLDLRLGLGALLQRTGAEPEAIAAYQEVVARDGTGAKALLARDRMAAIELSRGHTDVARRLAAEVLQKNSRDDDALSLRATIELRERDAAGAIADLRAVIRDRPNSVPLQRMLAGAYVAKGDPALAEETLRSAIQSAPTDASVRIELAHVLAQTGRAPQSLAVLQDAVRDIPDSVPAYEALIQADLSNHDPDKAIEAVKEALAAEPRSVQLLNLAGSLYLESKNFGRAGELFTRASAQDPSQWQAHRNLATLKAAENDEAGAAGEYRIALKLAPTEPQVVLDAASFYEKHARIDEAIAAYEGLYKGNTDVRDFAANNLAMLLVTYRSDQASLDRARELTSSFASSDNSQLLDTVGWVRFKRREYQDALTLLERASERAPQSKVIRYHLGMDELELGLRDRARANLEAALGGSGTFSGADEARLALATLKATAG
jgi:predicted Zn-dependent protease